MRLDGRRGCFGGLVLGAVFTVVVTGCAFLDDVDRCLDAGGSWSDATRTCLHHEPASPDRAIAREPESVGGAPR